MPPPRPPARPVYWSFTSNGAASSQRFETMAEAIIEASKWLEISAQNDFFPAVTITKSDKF